MPVIWQPGDDRFLTTTRLTREGFPRKVKQVPNSMHNSNYCVVKGPKLTQIVLVPSLELRLPTKY